MSENYSFRNTGSAAGEPVGNLSLQVHFGSFQNLIKNQCFFKQTYFNSQALELLPVLVRNIIVQAHLPDIELVFAQETIKITKEIFSCEEESSLSDF